MAALRGENNLAIFGYGALLTDLGGEDCPHPVHKPMADRTRDAVLSLTGATDLRQTEKILRENGAGP
jgi:hypothetical protein